MEHAAVTRRGLLALGAGASATAIASCGPNAQSDSGSAADGATELRMTWWGGETRRELTDAVVAEYTDVAPEVSVSTEPSEFSGYWDKLATQTAAQDAPDIIQMEEAYLTEYAERGALLDLSAAGLDTSGFTEGLADAGVIEGAGQVGVRGGSNAPVMLVNPALFEEAGVDMPDDTAWTWDEQLAIAEEIAAASEGAYGTSQFVVNPVVFRLWLRQQGLGIWKDGELGFDVDAATAFFEFADTVLNSEAGPAAEQTQEDNAGGIEQSLFATGRQAMTVAWTNQSVAFGNALGSDVALLRLPTAPGGAGDHQMWLKPGIFWSVASSSAAPDVAVEFLNFLLNSPDSGKHLGVERGIPPNAEVRDLVKGQLEGTELSTLEFVEAVTPEVGPDPEIAPMGGSVFESLLERVGESFMFGQIDAEGAAQSMVDELGAAIS
ncbi:MAG TPA: extracellular solute-binding protein [Candidatus Brachybacterium merdavium]|uniref:Extracellular solute-binding protein n=1 Tax=Candidatus Brachybacterium merdavium TaxID=2838513 RepID=A0A9D2LFT9_9MICO|nr:extracellular solute-binding protein [Candidatus Brachybacterium merdavium]